MKVEKWAKNGQMVQNSTPLSPGNNIALSARGYAAPAGANFVVIGSDWLWWGSPAAAPTILALKVLALRSSSEKR